MRCFFLILLIAISAKLNGQVNGNKQILGQIALIQSAYSSHSDSLSQLIEDGISMANEQNDFGAKVEILRIKGAFQFLSGEHTRAAETLIEGVKIGEQHKTNKELVTIYYELGTVYSKNRNIAFAGQYMRKGLSMAQSNRDTSGMADGYNRIGVMYENLGNLDSALYYYTLSRKMNTIAKNTLGLSYSLENMATVYSQQKKHELAIDYLKQAIEIRRSKNDQYGIAIATINISESYKEAGRMDSAIHYALLAEKTGRSINFLDLLQHTYKQLSEMYKGLGKHDVALAYHERYTALKDSIFNEGKSKQMAEMSVQFETERKEQQIKVLNKQKTIQRLALIVSVLALLTMIVVAYFIIKNRKIKEEKLRAEAAFQLQLKEVEARSAMQHERLRISRELHDNIGAHLTFINATVDGMDKNNAKTQQVKDLTNETIRELRKTVWLINKSSVRVEEFVLKLREFLKNIPQVQVLSTIEDTSIELNAEMITELFRTTQECVNNALKYSGADNIVVDISSSAEKITIEVKDNGCGFEIEELSNKGFGLENMQHRMEVLGGTCHIQSEKDKGTQIRMEVKMPSNTINIV
ncbi:MAG: sensor histidine kinase [Bacteroidota bacterium]